MAHKISNNTSSFEAMKLVLSFAILLGSLTAYYSFPDVYAVFRVLGVIAGLALSAYVFYMTEKGKGVFQYLSQAKKEVMLVVWPTRQETIQMTLLVFVAVIIMGIFMWLVDMFFLWGVQVLTGQGG